MKTIRGIKDMVKQFESVKMATTATRFYGDIKFLLAELEREYQTFYESDDSRPRFSNTDTVFEIGDTVDANGKLYEVEGFYRSMHADKNEVDWLRLRRLGTCKGTWADVHPSEAVLIARPVK